MSYHLDTEEQIKMKEYLDWLEAYQAEGPLISLTVILDKDIRYDDIEAIVDKIRSKSRNLYFW